MKKARLIQLIACSRLHLLPLLIPLLYVLLSGSPLHALDEGGGTVGFESRFDSLDTFLTDQNEYEVISHLDLWQNIPNVGRLALWIDWANASDGNDIHLNRLGNGFLELTGLRINNSTLDGRLGDSSTIFTNLPVRFSNSFYPGIYFQGYQSDLYGPRGEAHIFGGQVARIVGLFGKIYDTTREDFYGFKASYRLLPSLLLGTGYILTLDEVDNADLLVTKRNHIFLLESDFQALDWMRWLVQFSRSDYDGVLGRKDRSDTAFKIGPLLSGRNFKFETNYRRIGTDYRFVNEATQAERDQEGLFGVGEYRLWGDATFFGNFDLYHNNVSDEPRRNTLDTHRGLVGVSVFNPRYPSLFLTFDTVDQKTRSRFPSPIDNQTGTLFTEIRYLYKNFNPYARYRYVNYDDEISPRDQYDENVITVGFRQIFQGGSTVYIEGESDRKTYTSHETESRVSGKLGFNYYFPNNLSCWGEVIYGKLKDRTDDTRRNRMELSAGLNYQLPWDITLYADVRYDKTFAPEHKSLQAEGVQVNFRIAKAFHWGEREKISGLRAGIETRGFGTVAGFVFNDINRNGVQDKGEEGVRGITVRLEDGSMMKTDERGYYQFPRVEVGGHMVTLDVRRIPAAYSIISPENVRIEVRLRDTLTVNFQLVAAGRIQGRVISDANNNGKPDPGEKGIPDVLLLLEPRGMNTYSDEEGTFVLENVLPGSYLLKPDAVTLPEEGVITSSPELKFDISVGEELQDMNFLIYVKPRPIIIGPPKQ